MILLRPGSAEEAGFRVERLERTKRLVEDWCREGDGDLPYAVWTAARRGIIVADESVNIEPDRIFPIASISKVFTSTAAMLLAERGKLSPIRRVCEYIPEFVGEGKEDVLVFHLMTHTSGLEDYEVYEHIDLAREEAELPECPPNQHPSVHENLSLGFDAPLSRKPGELMSYCGFGIELLGELVRRTSGQSLAEFAQEHIFEPLGMRDSYFIVPEEAAPRVLQIPDGYAFDGLNRPERLAVPKAAGGMYSTARDLAVFGQMFLNKGEYNGRRILSAATVKAMTRNQIPGVGSQYDGSVFPEAGWGLGWIMSGDKRDETGTLRSPQTYYHTGAGCSILLVDPENEVVLAGFFPTKEYESHFDRRFDYLTDSLLGGLED